MTISATESAATNARIAHPDYQSKVMDAAAAASLIKSGDAVGMSGFTGEIGRVHV